MLVPGFGYPKPDMRRLFAYNGVLLPLSTPCSTAAIACKIVNAGSIWTLISLYIKMKLVFSANCIPGPQEMSEMHSLSELLEAIPTELTS